MIGVCKIVTIACFLARHSKWLTETFFLTRKKARKRRIGPSVGVWGAGAVKCVLRCAVFCRAGLPAPRPPTADCCRRPATAAVRSQTQTQRSDPPSSEQQQQPLTPCSPVVSMHVLCSHPSTNATSTQHTVTATVASHRIHSALGRLIDRRCRRDARASGCRRRGCRGCKEGDRSVRGGCTMRRRDEMQCRNSRNSRQRTAQWLIVVSARRGC